MKNSGPTKSTSMFGLDSETLEKTADQVEAALTNVVENHPLATVLAVFGVGLALGAAEEKLHLKDLANDVGRRIVAKDDSPLIEKIFDAAFGSLVLKTGITVLSEQLGNLIPSTTSKRSTAHGSATKAKLVN